MSRHTWSVSVLNWVPWHLANGTVIPAVGEVRRMHPEMPKQWPLILRLEWRWGGKVL